MRATSIPFLAALLAGGCATPYPAPPPPKPKPGPPPAPAPPAHDALERPVFNLLAQRLNLPLFWSDDTNGDGAVDPGEVVRPLFFASTPIWVSDGRFTAEFESAFVDLVSASKATQPAAEGKEADRQRTVWAELDQGRPTLVHSDLRALPANEKRAIERLLEAASLIDDLHATQTGAAALSAGLPDDPASVALFRRNWGPRCLAAKTEKNPDCSAIPGAPKPKVDVYPAGLQENAGFCESLVKRPDAKQLLAPFVVVREEDGDLVPQEYSDAYADPMGKVAERLEAAADELGPDEAALAEYLRAAAGAFRDNGWEAADEAWSRMSWENSKYYLRVGPDEVYWDPCSQKAGFHMSLALINRDSLVWQQKLLPLKQTMERSLARLIGQPYREREVTFHLPDFIDIIANAGNSRAPLGATIGQSLPNWGKVAEESRGRTVAMTNLFRDPDSLADSRAVVASLVDAEAEAMRTDDAAPGLLSTVLHEAAHNLGPAQGYKHKGMTTSLALGGGLASMMEELKAQTAALYYLDMLVEEGVIDAEMRKRTYLDAIRWAFGHISRGMWTQDGKRKPYSQLAAIQVGFLMDEGAVEWAPDQIAANGKDRGTFVLRFDRFPDACEKMMKMVGRIKATHDKAAGEELTKKYVDGDTVPRAIITERVLRQPRPTLLYSLEM